MTENHVALPVWCTEDFRKMDEVKELAVTFHKALLPHIEQMMVKAIQQESGSRPNLCRFKLTLEYRPEDHAV